MTDSGTGDVPAAALPPPPRRRFSLLVTLVCSAVVAIYVGLPLASLVSDPSPLGKLERPQESLTRLVTRELDLYHAMRQGSGLEWRLYQIFTGGEDPAREASAWYEELADTFGTPAAELYQAILLAEAGDPKAVEHAVAEWRAASPPAERMARWLAAAYLEPPPSDGEGRARIDEIRDELGPGWFADALAARIAARIGDAQARALAEAAIIERGRVLQGRLRLLMGFVGAVFTGGVVALVWFAVGRRPLRLAAAPLPPAWSPADGYALFVRGLGGPQALLLVFFLVRRDLPLEGAVAIAADLPVFWWVARHLGREGTSMREAFGLAPARGQRMRLAGLTLALISLTLVGDVAIDWGARLAGLAPHWADGLSETLVWEPLGAFAADALSAIVWAPIIEELVFRGLLYGTLRTRLGVWPAALGSAVIFALPHGYAVAGSLSVLMSGILWAVAYERTRSLLPGVLAHSANNLMSTLWVAGLLRM